MLSASTNSGNIDDFIMESARLNFSLIHKVLHIIPSLYTSLAAFTEIINGFYVVEALPIITLNSVSLSVNNCIFNDFLLFVSDRVV